MIPTRSTLELWSDGATAERLLAVPGDGRIGAGRRRESGSFPRARCWSRTVSIALEPGKPASRRRIETQILHLEAEAWRPYSYVWNDDQTDAALADAARDDHATIDA